MPTVATAETSAMALESIVLPTAETPPVVDPCATFIADCSEVQEAETLDVTHVADLLDN